MKTKQTRTAAIGGVIVGVVLGIMSYHFLAARAGDLEPPGPPGPTMKTLNEVEPPIPIPGSATPTSAYIINEPGSYYLTGDRAASGASIQIRSSDVTLDLMGYTLSGPGKVAGGWIGIEIGYIPEEYENVEIRNGTVRDFGLANIQSISSCNNVRIMNVRVTGGGRGIALYGAFSLAKDCTAVKNSLGIFANMNGIVTNCIASENEGNGISVTFYSLVQGSTANKNGFDGIDVWAQSSVIGNTAIDNGEHGIDCGYGGVIIANAVSANTLDGINAQDGCTVKNNVAQENDDDGIETGDGCTLQNNTVYGNEDYGIYAGSGCTVIGNTGHDQANDYGIRAFHGSTLKDNTAYNNYRGIYAGEGCTVFGNTAYNNVTWGIYVYGESLVDRNTAYNNVTGGGGEQNLRTDATCTVLTNHAP